MKTPSPLEQLLEEARRETARGVTGPNFDHMLHVAAQATTCVLPFGDRKVQPMRFTTGRIHVCR